MKTHNHSIDKCFLNFFNERMEYLRKCKRFGTYYNYRRAKTSLENFLDCRSLCFGDIDQVFIESYYDWLLLKGMTRNSVSFHLRIIRAVYNKGVRLGYCNQKTPFLNVYTGIDKTRKRCVNDEILHKLRSLTLECPSLELTRDLFLFSVYTRGMAFVDMAHLRLTDIQGENIVYRRKKTGQLLTIRIEKQIKEILKKYMKGPENKTYIFPILSVSDPATEYTHYCRAISAYNYRLKKLSAMLGDGVCLTSYTARHTWASLAYKYNIPLAMISAGMGHTSEKTTRIYLETIDNRQLDEANRSFLKRLGV